MRTLRKRIERLETRTLPEKQFPFVLRFPSLLRPETEERMREAGQLSGSSLAKVASIPKAV